MVWNGIAIIVLGIICLYIGLIVDVLLRVHYGDAEKELGARRVMSPTEQNELRKHDWMRAIIIGVAFFVLLYFVFT